MTTPCSTLRLQLHRGFTFDDAAAQLNYFAALGVSHLYLSPITTSMPGSMHGYDTVDYTRVNPELGGERALLRLAESAHARQMGLIADIVPNHMSTNGAHNAWWRDILEWGRHSAYSRYFDIDWHSPDPALRGKVLVPCLGAPYGEELDAGRITVQFDQDAGRFFTGYADHIFPICPAQYATMLQAATHPELATLAASFIGLTPQPADQRQAEQARAALHAFAAREHGMLAIGAVLAAYAPDTPAGRERLHRLLEQQFFRLAWWRTAADDVNWRRFFDIDTLAAVRAERPEVFEASHALILRLFALGVIDGIRVDHVDGLVEPREYCQRLRERLTALEAQRPRQTRGEHAYLIVEKILGRGESLADDWGVDGTTGYDFMNDMGALLHDAQGAAPLTAAWADISASTRSFAQEALVARRKILRENLSAELDRASRALHRIARGNLATRDFTFTSIRRALAELALHFPVYRIYPHHGMRGASDNLYFGQALETARRALPRADHPVLERVAQWLGGQAPNKSPPSAPLDANACARSPRNAPALFAQLTAPLAAKAIEDTACYRYGRLLSRNEVGSDPGEFALSVEAFHAANLARSQHFPHAMLATATHDHKRGEDVRARLAVLSEIAQEWRMTLHAWSTLNAPRRRALNGNERDWAPGPAAEAMLYQTLVGCWPYELDPNDEAGVNALAERVAAWQEKALREAKVRTSWYARDDVYEQASRAFLFDVLAPQRRNGFLRELCAFVARIGPAGALNSLLQTVLRLTSPGVPDLYQGTELWDLSLVDPDNRRPVDFAQRHAWLTDSPPNEQLANWRDARVKLGIVHRALGLRAASPALFLEGSYIPLTTRGKLARHLIAFARQYGDAYAIVIGTRHASALLDDGRDVPHVDPAKWEDTAVTLPPALASQALTDWLSPTAPKADHAANLRASDSLAALPIAILVTDSLACPPPDKRRQKTKE
jgi:(1->4)-alpha-D-glucan 1-alpha-D-glucosylmutase